MVELARIESTREAIEDHVRGPNRTTLFGIHNKTGFPIEVAFGKITSTVSANGYIADTGLFTFCSGANGGLPDLFDPLVAKNWRVFGQYGEMSVMILGQTASDAYPQTSGANYYPTMEWTIKASLRDGKLNVEIERDNTISAMK